MALKLPKLDFSKLSARSRLLVLLGAAGGAIGLLYFSFQLFTTDTSTVGASKVANAPTGLQSVPGSQQLSPAYYRTLVQANAQAAQQAQMSGGSAIPTLINNPNPSDTSQNCTILCPNPEKANIQDDLNELVKSGKLSQKEADKLANLAKQNVSIAEYAAALDELVKQGKLTPEQARLLLEKYKKQHGDALLTESASAMDSLIRTAKT
jgi:polyhydroxyalkanoate synthesis regulator phasin